jgi:hypothetical protein
MDKRGFVVLVPEDVDRADPEASTTFLDPHTFWKINFDSNEFTHNRPSFFF